MGTGADEEEELPLEVGTEAVEVEVLPSAIKNNNNNNDENATGTR